MTSKSVIPASVLCMLAYLSFPSDSSAMAGENRSRQGFYFAMQAGVYAGFI